MKKQRRNMLLIERLINTVFEDNGRTISQEKELEIWSLSPESDVSWDGTSSKRLVFQPQWLKLYDLLIYRTLRYGLLEGKAGQGKSVFLRYMIIRMLEDDRVPEAVTIAYVVKESMRSSCIFWITKKDSKGVVDQIEKINKTPDYLFFDNVDSALNMSGVKLTLGLTSGNKDVLKEMNKKVGEAGHLGKKYTMTALDMIVMGLIFPDFSLSELQFRFDVLGGNPSRFRWDTPTCLSEQMEQLTYSELHICILMFFGEKYNYMMKTSEGLLADWAMKLIVKELQGSADCDSSLFHAEFEITDVYYQERYASTFLQLVAGALDSKDNANLKDALKKIVGSSGLGYAHKYLSHKIFVNGDKDTTTFGLSESKEIVSLTGLYGRNVTLVRNIDDLAKLKNVSTYGLPIFSNFPGVDAVVSPYLLQMTISERHGGAMDKLPIIAEKLGVSTSDLRLVFVVESIQKAKDFKFPWLPEITMIVTPREVCTALTLQ